jgi:hypothetical protein
VSTQRVWSASLAQQPFLGCAHFRSKTRIFFRVATPKKESPYPKDASITAPEPRRAFGATGCEVDEFVEPSARKNLRDPGWTWRDRITFAK